MNLKELPLPMFFSHYVFSEKFFLRFGSFHDYRVLAARKRFRGGRIWALLSGTFSVLLPIWESRRSKQRGCTNHHWMLDIPAAIRPPQVEPSSTTRMFIDQRLSVQICVTGGINIRVVKGGSKIAFQVLWVSINIEHVHEVESPSADIRGDKKIARKKTGWKK